MDRGDLMNNVFKRKLNDPEFTVLSYLPVASVTLHWTLCF
jgi:hypothetical protein